MQNLNFITNNPHSRFLECGLLALYASTWFIHSYLIWLIDLTQIFTGPKRDLLSDLAFLPGPINSEFLPTPQIHRNRSQKDFAND
jgi:hypothetical protein